MTDEHTPNDEMQSYTVTASRKFEMDLSEAQKRGLMKQMSVETPEEALEEMLLTNEIESIEPEQKLLGADVTVDEPSDE